MAPRTLSMMSSASPSSQCGWRVQVGAVGARLLVRAAARPRCGRDVGLLAADRDVGVGGVRDPQQQVLELGLGGRELGVDRLDPLAGARWRRAQLGDLGAVRASRRRGSPRRSACDAVLRSALSVSDSDWSRRRVASTSIARSTTAGSSRLSIAPCRIRSGPRGAAGRRRSCHRLRELAGLARAGGSRSRGRGSPAASRPAGRWAGRGTRGRGR